MHRSSLAELISQPKNSCFYSHTSRAQTYKRISCALPTAPRTCTLQQLSRYFARYVRPMPTFGSWRSLNGTSGCSERSAVCFLTIEPGKRQSLTHGLFFTLLVPLVRSRALNRIERPIVDSLGQGLLTPVVYTNWMMTSFDAAELMPDTDQETVNDQFRNSRCYTPLPSLHVGRSRRLEGQDSAYARSW